MRSLLLCLFLVPVSVYWQMQMESVRNATHPTALALPFHVVFILLVVAGLNRLFAKQFGERNALAPGELLLTYSVLAISSAVAGIDMLQVLIPVITYGFRFSAANGWGAVTPLLPKHLTISDPAIYDRYYIGSGSVWQPAILAAWFPVVCRWTLFVALLLWVMLCLNAILRRAWTENERLTFPVVQLPLQIADPVTWSAKGLFGNPLFWVGVLVAGVPDLFNGLNYFFPAIPAMGYTGNGYSYTDLNDMPGLIQYFSRPPWSAMGEVPLSFYPFVIGLGVLMPLDFLFSVPVFYWFWKLQKVGVVALALDMNPRFPYVEGQAFGAYLSFCALSLYVARHYLRDVWRKACGKEGVLDDSGEPMPYRLAVFGGLAGFVGLTVFTATMGLSPLLGILFFLVYFALALAITRMRAEIGTPVHDLHFTGPEMLMTRIAGTRAFDGQNLVALGMLQWFTQAHRSHPMPHQLESYKLCDDAGGAKERRAWTAVLMAGGVFAAFAAFWIYLDLMYHYGATAQVRFTQGYGTYARIAGWLQNPVNGNPGELFAVLGGFAIASAMQVARLYFPWFPLHPLAFAVTSSYQMNLVWLPLTMAWVAKATLLRFGGLKTFRRALPFFFGLMIGQFVVGGIWNILGTIANVPTYRFWD